MLLSRSLNFLDLSGGQRLMGVGAEVKDTLNDPVDQYSRDRNSLEAPVNCPGSFCFYRQA